jgi:cell division protein FtsL
MTPPAASAAAAPAINPRRRTATPRRAPAAPRRPRRISGPADPARGRAGSIHGQTRGQTRSAVGLAEAVATHRLLDRLIRGRIWIGVIAFALIGIVTMQLGLLKLNAGIGRSLAQETQLQRENATLSTENSEMAAGERVETQAEHAGMELIPAGTISFLAAHPSSDLSKAATALSTAASTPSASTTVSGTEATSGTAATSEAAASSAGSEASTTATGATSETGTATSASTAATGATPESTGASGTTPEATTPASTPTETAASGASTETSAGGASEAASPSPSASTSTGGGTTPGG